MLFRSYIPGPPLNEYIDRIWLGADMPPRPRERILPSGTLDLVISLNEDEIRIFDPSDPERALRHSGAAVSGPYRNAFHVDPLQRTIMGVHFQPGRAVSILGVPAHEFAGAHVDLDAIWGRNARELRERLCAAATPEKKFALLEKEFLARLSHARTRHDAIPVALDAFEQADVKVRDLAREVGLSQRRFIQLFTADVGMTPKLYGRVRRFQRARQLMQTTAEPDWAALAVDCGFFDQSHLIRDFEEFAGLSPEAYLEQTRRFVRPAALPWVG